MVLNWSGHDSHTISIVCVDRTESEHATHVGKSWAIKVAPASVHTLANVQA